MTRRLVLAAVTLAAFILLVVEVPLGLTYAGRQRDRLLADIERDARVLGGTLQNDLAAGDTDALTRTVSDYANRTTARVVVVDTDGIGLADTDNPGDVARDFSTRPEFQAALGGSQATGIRRSETLGDEVAYAAVPVVSGGEILGAVRVSFSTRLLREQVRDNWLRIGVLSALVLVSAGGFGLLTARWAIRPIVALDNAVARLAEGKLDTRVDPDLGPPELRQLSTTFNNMAARLEGLVGSQRAFVADASHQLRTPLTALRLRLDGIAELLDGGDLDVARDELAKVDDEIDRLGTLVEGLLTLARAEGSSVPVRAVDATEVVRSSADRWTDLAAEHDISIEIDLDDGVRALVVDGGLEQVLDNLLDNAMGVAPAGSIVEVGLRDGDPVRLWVRDHGPGLDAEGRARATDRFWRSPDAPAGGTGLGLAIVAELVRASGGTVSLEAPTVGPGLHIEIRLPSG